MCCNIFFLWSGTAMTAQQLDNMVADALPIRTPWKRSARGNWTRLLPDGTRLTVFRNGSAWYWCNGTETEVVYSRPYPTEKEAFDSALALTNGDTHARN
jgi:hypothetical protein